MLSPFDRLIAAQDELAALAETCANLAYGAQDHKLTQLALALERLTAALRQAIESFCTA